MTKLNNLSEFLILKNKQDNRIDIAFYKGYLNEIKAQVKDIDTIASELNHRKIDLLKMDIEGAEYEVIKALPDSKIKINQILIEFHHMYKDISVSQTVEAINTLKKLGFELFNISQRTYEFSFKQRELEN